MARTRSHLRRAAWLPVLAAPLAMGLVLAAMAPPGPPANASGTPGAGAAFDHDLVVDVVAMACPAGLDNGGSDDVCLGYAGQVPGPTWVFAQGDHVRITLRHRVADSLAALDPALGLSTGDATRMREAIYTLHRHGLSHPADQDSIFAPEGTELVDSSLPPGGSVSYVFTAAFVGAWHYHDHSLDPAAGSFDPQPGLGHEAIHRGLFGAFLVLAEGETTDHVFDLHLFDHTAPNRGLGLEATVAVGDRFDILVSGLDDKQWEVTLNAPDGSEAGSLAMGPGLSRSLTVAGAVAGTYTWTATSVPLGETFTGEVVAQ